MPNQNPDQERAFKQFMMPRLFGLAAVVEHPNDSETFPMCSGVIIEAQGFFVLVTVAHFLKDLMKWEKQKRLVDVQLIIHDESGFSGTIKLDLDKNEMLLNESIDVGFIILESDVLDKIERHNGKAVRSEAATTSNDDLPDRFFLVGHASAHAQISTDTISTSEHFEWQIQKLSSLAIAFVPLELNGKGDDPQTFRFTPIRGIDDYSGASGGPIFGYKDGSAIRDYCLFAIQSKQVRAATKEQKVKHLIGTSGAFAVKAINILIDSLKT